MVLVVVALNFEICVKYCANVGMDVPHVCLEKLSCKVFILLIIQRIRFLFKLLNALEIGINIVGVNIMVCTPDVLSMLELLKMKCSIGIYLSIWLVWYKLFVILIKRPTF